MNIFSRALLVLFLPAGVAWADEWNTSWDGTLYGYPAYNDVRMDSVLNPDNRIARLKQHLQTAEARFNLKAENEELRLTLRPIAIWQHDDNAYGENVQSETYISQGQLRWRLNDAWSMAGGREVLNWGAGQFRSPSNPFYFDNGKSNPLRELSGLDAVKFSYTPDLYTSISLAYIGSAGRYEGNPDPWRDTWLLRSSLRGSRWAGGLAVVNKDKQQAFAGMDAQYSLEDAWLLYGELGSSTRLNALQSAADAAQPFTVDAESARKTSYLAGLSYTLENGQSVTLEYLHFGHGYTADEEAAYFARAANAALPAGAPALGMALSFAPPLQGQDYLHLMWQNNFLEADSYWRLMLTRSLTDQGTQLAAYAETRFNSRVSGFGMLVRSFGNAQQEFSSMFESMVSGGLKVALP